MRDNNIETKTVWATAKIDDEGWKNSIKADFNYFAEKGRCDSPVSVQRTIKRYFYIAKQQKFDPAFDDFFSRFHDELEEKISELNFEYLEDEKVNLNIKTQGEIIAIGDDDTYEYLGNNIKSVVAFVHNKVTEGCNISLCVKNQSYGEIELQADTDCTSYAFREMRADLTDKERSNFEQEIIQGTIKASDYAKYSTSLGQSVCDIYGFEFKNDKSIRKDNIERE